MLNLIRIAMIGLVALGNPMIVMAQLDEALRPCVVTNETDEAVDVYRWGSDEYDVIDSLPAGESQQVIAGNEAGWYQIFRLDSGLTGWVSDNDVTASGNCDALLLAEEIPFGESDSMGAGGMATVMDNFVILRAEPDGTSAILGNAAADEELQIIAQTTSNDEVWYLVVMADGALAWARATAVSLAEGAVIQVIAPPEDQPELNVAEEGETDDQNQGLTQQLNLQDGTSEENEPDTLPDSGLGGQLSGETESDSNEPQLSLPAEPTATPADAILQPQDTANIVAGNWSHVTTVNEHGCGPAGVSETIFLSITPAPDESNITLTYQTGVNFTLSRTQGASYAGSYFDGRVVVTLTFTSPTTYTANETVTHESGCVVRSSWVGSAG